ncbi:MAG: amidohydrolase [Chthonomonadales bacterium]
MTIYHNANIHTMNPAMPHAEAIAVDHGQIVAIGTMDDVKSRAGNAHSIDLRGRTMVPGFNDCHMHVLPYGLDLSQANLSPSAGVTSVPELLVALKAWAQTNPNSDWILGSRYDQNTFPGAKHPTKTELDATFPNNPVYVMQTSKHGGTANSVALKLAGITRDTPDPDGGEIVRDANGEPTGVLLESAIGLVTHHIPKPTRAGKIAAIRQAQDVMVQAGITSASDLNTGWFDIETEVDCYQRAALDGAPIRMTLFPHIPQFGAPSDVPTRADFWKEHFEGGPDQVRLGCAKLFSDGALTVRTAAVRTPYVDGSGSGMFLHEPEELFAYIEAAQRGGWNIAIHAIGDRAIELCLNGYAAAQSAFPRSNTRHRIEHSMILDDALIQRYVDQKVIPVIQPEFIARLGDAYILGIGLERASRLNRTASLLKAGLPVPLSSDCPIVPGAPLDGIRAAHYRTSRKGVVLGLDEAMSAKDALRGYTEWASFSVCDEERTGVLKPGMQADMVILSHDPLAGEDDLRAAGVEATIIAGEVVYGIDTLI